MELHADSLIQASLLYLPRLAGAFLLFAAFWLTGTLTRRVVFRLARDTTSERQAIIRLMAKGTHVTLVLVGGISALGTLGVNIGAMVAGLGLTGFALGLALRDILSNVVSGVLVLLYRPFKRDDRITVSGFEGTVVSVDLRYTILKTEKGKVLIPNATLFTQNVLVGEAPE